MTLVNLTNKELYFVKTSNTMAISRLLHLQDMTTNNKVKRRELDDELTHIIKMMREEYHYDT